MPIKFSYDVGKQVAKKTEERISFEERVEELINNLEGFFAYNPIYKQEGVMQVAVSARMDVGTYQYSSNGYAENILVSKNSRQGAEFYVAGLGDFRKVFGMVGKRCYFSRTYYVWEEDGIYKCHLLLENLEQYKAKCIDLAFAWILKQVSG